MQQSRRHHGSSAGELDVFGATSYFAGGLPDFEPSADRLIQANKVTRGTMMQGSNSFRGPRHVPDDEQLGLHDEERLSHSQLGVVVKPSGKSKLAALLSFMVSSRSPRASFRKESPPSPPVRKLLAAGDEPAKAASSSSPSRESISVQLQGCSGGVHELDLGVAVGDRRLQGVRVVRGGSGGEERWVVRCGAWEEEHHEKMLDDAESSDPKDDDVEEGHDGNPAGDDWESDSSSDLFDLDIEYIC